ncbi:M24 family metallopeptidase [Sphingomonas sabuli]|uniref:M24 family metallopeptidase n=1 Tax=Sphingomonas sabuli TaxID=2764186 RepID=A0A7G9L2A0_9SPHN|nr:M24 family metallopeptidase [Sphingomonas sabuli]QNM82749.1 M24 family metallopeptidase [Sphingomonas sabuli]
MRGWGAVLLTVAALGAPVAAARAVQSNADAEVLGPKLPPIPTPREEARIRDQLLTERVKTILPRLMREQGIDAWVLSAREYADDVVMKSFFAGEQMTARRQTILLIVDPGAGQPLETHSIARYKVGDIFKPAWQPESKVGQFDRLAAMLRGRNVRRIAINVSPDNAFADGLSKGQHDAMMAAFGPELAARTVSSSPLVTRWLETRTPAELKRQGEVVRITHAILGEMYSRKVITPGRTSADDARWWLRERIAGLGLGTWFSPSISIFRNGSKELDGDAVIQPGDLLHVDFGVTLYGLNSDVQHLAYVLRPGEREAPAGLRAGLRQANRMQALLLDALPGSASGNGALVKVRAAMAREGIDGTVYSHPLGLHGHGAGPAIGFWDDQAPSPRGAAGIYPNTGWSIELQATAAVPEWGGQKVPFRLEENGWWDGRAFHWFDGHQQAFHLIPGDPAR